MVIKVKFYLSHKNWPITNGDQKKIFLSKFLLKSSFFFFLIFLHTKKMSKRTTEDMDISDFKVPKAPFGQPQEKIKSIKELEGIGDFEDPWEDEYETESEEEVVEEENNEDKEGDGTELDKI